MVVMGEGEHFEPPPQLKKKKSEKGKEVEVLSVVFVF